MRKTQLDRTAKLRIGAYRFKKKMFQIVRKFAYLAKTLHSIRHPSRRNPLHSDTNRQG